MADVPDVLTMAEAARYLRVHQATLRRWMQEGIVPYSKMPKRVLFRKASLDQVLQQAEQRPVAEVAAASRRGAEAEDAGARA
jgi:excisionase family DNA binding protein